MIRGSRPFVLFGALLLGFNVWMSGGTGEIEVATSVLSGLMLFGGAGLRIAELLSPPTPTALGDVEGEGGRSDRA